MELIHFIGYGVKIPVFGVIDGIGELLELVRVHWLDVHLLVQVGLVVFSHLVVKVLKVVHVVLVLAFLPLDTVLQLRLVAGIVVEELHIVVELDLLVYSDIHHDAPLVFELAGGNELLLILVKGQNLVLHGLFFLVDLRVKHVYGHRNRLQLFADVGLLVTNLVLQLHKLVFQLARRNKLKLLVPQILYLPNQAPVLVVKGLGAVGADLSQIGQIQLLALIV